MARNTASTSTSNHAHDLMLKMDNDRSTCAKYCDFTLVAGDKKFPIHKSVLGSLSSFFDKMFDIDMKEKRENEAEINGVTEDTLEDILDFVYTGSITLTMNNVYEIVEAAHFMDLPYVTETCMEYLGSQINAKTCLTIRAYAQRYDFEGLLKKVDEVVAHKFDSVIRSKHFVELDIEELKFLLKLENKKVKSENDIYEAVVFWIKQDLIGHEKYAEELLNCIDYSKLTLNFLKEKVSKEKLIEASFCLTRAVLNAISGHSGITCQMANSAVAFSAVDDVSVMVLNSDGFRSVGLMNNHEGGSAVCDDGRVHVIGGLLTKEIEEVNLSNMKIENRGSTIHYRCASASIMVDDELCVMGGLNVESTAETGDLSYVTGKWQLSSEVLDWNRQGHAAVSLLNSLYIVGGDVAPEESLLVRVLSQKTKRLAPLKTKRIGLAAVAYRGELYAISGSSRHKFKAASVEKYHPLSNQWKAVATLNVARSCPGACVIGDRIVVVGGGSPAIEVYDANENKWNIVQNCEAMKNVFAIFPV